MSILLPVSARRFDWVSMARDLDTVLFDLHCLADDLAPDAAPPPVVVAVWCRAFPEHARAIRAHVAAWRDLDALNAEHVARS